MAAFAKPDSDLVEKLAQIMLREGTHKTIGDAVLFANGIAKDSSKVDKFFQSRNYVMKNGEWTHPAKV